VHGRDFKPGAIDFGDLSISALTMGIERDCAEMADHFNALDKRLAYYGDISNEFLASKGLRYDETLDIGDRRNALIKIRALEKKKNFSVTRYDRLPGKSALSEFFADTVAPLAGGIGLSSLLMRKVGADLSEYWNAKSDFAERLRERVRSSICDALDDGSQIMLLTHGTGCIVAYDVLWQISHDAQYAEKYPYDVLWQISHDAQYAEKYRDQKIDVWLTLGAPLGDSMVRRRLLGARKKGVDRYPSVVVSWHNVSAEDDYLSHDNTLADDFKPMLRQKQVSFIREWLQQGQVTPLPKSIF